MKDFLNYNSTCDSYREHNLTLIIFMLFTLDQEALDLWWQKSTTELNFKTERYVINIILLN